VTEFHF